MLRFIILLLLGLPLAGHAAEEVRYYEVPALQGDGTIALLRRYDLDRFSCNRQLFLQLNQLSQSDGLTVGDYYKLPIRVYRYNGNTIRSTIGIDDYEQALSIQKFNEWMLAQGLRTTPFIEDRKLYVPNHLIKCPKPDIQRSAAAQPVAQQAAPSSTGINLATAPGKNRVYPIFGPDYEKTPLIDRSLQNRVFYIVSGHGGPDPGAVGKRKRNDLCEDEYAYDVSLRLVRKLIEHGAVAYMIVRDPNDGIRDDEFLDCDRDEVVWGGAAIPLSQKARLRQRSSMINTLYEKHKKQGVISQEVLVIHVDSRSKSTQTDLFFYYSPESKSSKALAGKLHRTMQRKYKKHRANGEYHGTVTGRNLHMLRETKPTSVYIELGNIRHPRDQKRIVWKSNRQALANWLYDGLIE